MIKGCLKPHQIGFRQPLFDCVFVWIHTKDAVDAVYAASQLTQKPDIGQQIHVWDRPVLYACYATQSKITLPLWPESIAAKPCSKSATLKWWVIIGLMSKPD